CATCLLPPAILMGASLPVLSRCFEPTPTGRGHLGLLYAANTIGAVVGCLLAGFYLLPVHDTLVATLVAAMITGALAVASLTLSPAGAKPKRTATFMPCTSTDRVASHLVLTTIAVSGLCALGAEVVWTRLLSLILGATVYTFSVILAVYLTGL